MSDSTPVVTRIGAGMFRVEHDGQSHIVYVAGRVGRRTVFANGQVFREEKMTEMRESAGQAGAPRTSGPETVRAPMPARILTLHAQPGAPVRKGDALVVLEAMKMEMPIYAPRDGRVSAVHCRQGDLVEADAVLVELE